MLIIGILTMISSADAIPQGTVVKDGVLTYPAGPYLREDPFLLSLESYGNYNTTASGNSSDMSEKELLHFNNCNNIIYRSPATGKLWIYPSNIFSIHFSCNAKILYPNSVFLCCLFLFFLIK
ncbi:MAG TPA: hypothetical protein HA306_05840 [Methanosarcina sp.]|nr:hypothetical protein [Methanosarcina sp.]